MYNTVHITYIQSVLDRHILLCSVLNCISEDSLIAVHLYILYMLMYNTFVYCTVTDPCAVRRAARSRPVLLFTL